MIRETSRYKIHNYFIQQILWLDVKVLSLKRGLICWYDMETQRIKIIEMTVTKMEKQPWIKKETDQALSPLRVSIFHFERKSNFG